MECIYFDHAATTPTDPEVVKAMDLYFFQKYGNASSPHSIGREASKALEDSRNSLAKAIGASAEEIIFNSGATEGNNHVIYGVAETAKSKGKHMVVSSIEHHSVLEPIEHLSSLGFKVTYLKVDSLGRVDPQEVNAAMTNETILVAVMHASNEVGTIEPIAQIGKYTRAKGVPLLVDAVQTIGHIPVHVQELGCDFLTLSAHKFYGPKGIGALYKRKGTKLGQFLRGGDQEKNQRASTQNVAGAVGLAKALETSISRMNEEKEFQAKLRDKLLCEVPKIVSGVKVNGDLSQRLPNNTHFSFEKVQGESLLVSLDLAGMCCSMGSACTSGAMEPSHVLRAMGLSDELAFGSLRITLGRWTKEADIDYFLSKLPTLIKGLRI